MPDADTKQSFMGKILPFWLIAKHRGMLHSIWAVIFFTCLVGHFWNWYYGESLGVGYLIHLIMDSFTPFGIKWFGRRRKRKK